MNRPALAVGTRLRYDAEREERMLLVPEGAVRLNETAAAVLELCDGSHSVEEIAGTLADRYDGANAADIGNLLDALGARGFVVDADG